MFLYIYIIGSTWQKYSQTYQFYMYIFNTSNICFQQFRTFSFIKDPQRLRQCFHRCFPVAHWDWAAHISTASAAPHVELGQWSEFKLTPSLLLSTQPFKIHLCFLTQLTDGLWESCTNQTERTRGEVHHRSGLLDYTSKHWVKTPQRLPQSFWHLWMGMITVRAVT